MVIEKGACETLERQKTASAHFSSWNGPSTRHFHPHPPAHDASLVNSFDSRDRRQHVGTALAVSHSFGVEELYSLEPVKAQT